MTKLAVVLDQQQVLPGETVTGAVFSNWEGKAKSLTIELVNRETIQGSSKDRPTARLVIDTPQGVRAGERFAFSFPLPLGAAPSFESRTPAAPISGSTGIGSWGVAAKIVRDLRLDHNAFAVLDVRPHPPSVPVMALVYPEEIEAMNAHRERGINTAQASSSRLLAAARSNAADSIGLRCDPPAARLGHALMVDVNVPIELGSDFSVGLFLYQSCWTSAQTSEGVGPVKLETRELWSHAVPVPGAGNHRMVLPVPPGYPPTHHGIDVANWWDVRPCLGAGARRPSQRSSQPVIIRA